MRNFGLQRRNTRNLPPTMALKTPPATARPNAAQEKTQTQHTITSAIHGKDKGANTPPQGESKILHWQPLGQTKRKKDVNAKANATFSSDANSACTSMRNGYYAEKHAIRLRRFGNKHFSSGSNLCLAVWCRTCGEMDKRSGCVLSVSKPNPAAVRTANHSAFYKRENEIFGK